MPRYDDIGGDNVDRRHRRERGRRSRRGQGRVLFAAALLAYMALVGVQVAQHGRAVTAAGGRAFPFPVETGGGDDAPRKRFIVSEDSAVLTPSNDNDADVVAGANKKISTAADTQLPEMFKGRTVALVEPFFSGGFRNQHMRFVALLVHAARHRIPNVLLPSLKWGDVVSKHTHGISHDKLFDVEYWNRGVEESRRGNKPYLKSVTETAPSLVRYVPALHSQCWNNETELFRNISESVVRSAKYLNHPRQYDLLLNVSHCTEPFGHGSGNVNHNQRLWNEYIRLQRERKVITLEDGTESLEEHHPVEKMAYRLLRPSAQMQHVIDETLSKQGLHRTNGTGPDVVEEWSGLLALHPRVELDMFGHRCSKVMEQNLTKIFGMIEDHFATPGAQTVGQARSRFDRVFIAVSRSFMEIKSGRKYEAHKDLADSNLKALNDAVRLGLWNRNVPVFESGERTVEGTVDQEHVAIAAGVVNFFLAVEAEAFVGTYGSSYSTDIWTARYYLGRGDGNYEHGKDGIKKIGGLPRVHKCD